MISIVGQGILTSGKPVGLPQAKSITIDLIVDIRASGMAFKMQELELKKAAH
jgi:hypothetical protein